MPTAGRCAGWDTWSHRLGLAASSVLRQAPALRTARPTPPVSQASPLTRALRHALRRGSLSVPLCLLLSPRPQSLGGPTPSSRVRSEPSNHDLPGSSCISWFLPSACSVLHAATRQAGSSSLVRLLGLPSAYLQAPNVRCCHLKAWRGFVQTCPGP